MSINAKTARPTNAQFWQASTGRGHYDDIQANAGGRAGGWYFPAAEIDLSRLLACLCGYRVDTGAGFLISVKYLLPLTVAFLAISTLALGFRASRRHGYGPFWMGVAAAAVILTGKFYFDAAQATYAGVGLLVAASVWNSWPRRAVTTPLCAACVPAEAGFTQRNAQGEKVYETQN